MPRRSVILPTFWLSAVVALAALDVMPVAIWLYPLAWYPLLFLLDSLVLRLGGESFTSRLPELGVLLFWSAVIWFGFEAINLRLANWYYVYVPVSRWQRWTGAALAFATVVPAIVLPARLLELRHVGDRLVTHPIRIGRRDLNLALALGIALLGVVLALPRALYPLAWGAVWLIAEPLLHRTDPAHSLFADIAAGRFGRIVRLMAGGLVAGIIWESLNALARTRWIYTVPFLEHLKIFEMPLLGFVGFPFFALEAWSLYYLLKRWTKWWTVIPATLAILVILAAMDQRTFASTLPYLRQLPTVDAALAEKLERAGLHDAFGVVRVGPAALIREGMPSQEAAELYALARVAALRGIGCRNAGALAKAGYESVERLGTADPHAVWEAVRRPDAPHPSPAEVRVWVAAARGLSAL